MYILHTNESKEEYLLLDLESTIQSGECHTITCPMNRITEGVNHLLPTKLRPISSTEKIGLTGIQQRIGGNILAIKLRKWYHAIRVEEAHTIRLPNHESAQRLLLIGITTVLCNHLRSPSSQPSTQLSIELMFPPSARYFAYTSIYAASLKPY